MAVASSLYRMANRLAEGHLDEILAEYFAQGLSADAIAARLFADHGIEASRPTIVSWLNALPETTKAAAS